MTTRINIFLVYSPHKHPINYPNNLVDLRISYFYPFIRVLMYAKFYFLRPARLLDCLIRCLRDEYTDDILIPVVTYAKFDQIYSRDFNLK